MNISAPTAASPVQPFFSNIGVSVGMPWMLLYSVFTTASWVRFMMSLELSNDPVSRGGRVQPLGREGTTAAGRVAGPAGDLDVLEALVGEAGLPRLGRTGAREGEAVGLEAELEAAVVVEVDATVGAQLLGVRGADRGAGRTFER